MQSRGWVPAAWAGRRRELGWILVTAGIALPFVVGMLVIGGVMPATGTPQAVHGEIAVAIGCVAGLALFVTGIKLVARTEPPPDETEPPSER